MKVALEDKICIIQREQGDPKFYNSRGSWGSGESRHLYHIQKALIAQGYDVIKKRMWRDGHLVDDEQQYIRTRKGFEPSFMIYDSEYALRLLNEDYNNNERIRLAVVRDIWKTEKEMR